MATRPEVTPHRAMTVNVPEGSGKDQQAHLAAVLATAREDYAVDTRSGANGRQVQARFADRMDELLRTIAETARTETGTPFVVCALGGYGRRALCLHSDIDLLIVFGGPIARPEERFVNALLHPLWDLKLTVGQHVRELTDFDEPDTGNPEFLLALLDARFLAGDQRLSATLVERLQHARRETDVPVLDALTALVAERHARFNDTFYQLEPDIKNAPGGLRDVAAIRFMRLLAAEAFRTHSDGEVMTPDRQGLADADVRLTEAENFLLRIRSVLHLESGRDSNVLTHELQEKIADAFGYQGDQPQQHVEALMGEYFQHARAISRALEWAGRKVQAPAEKIATRPVGRHLVMAGDGIRFTDPARAAFQPALWIEAFRVAVARGCPVSESVQAIIRQNVARYTADDFVSTEGERLQILGMLHPRPGLYGRLSEMHDCELLERIFPEFARIHCRVIRDFYHKYTVDEHTLLAIRGLESLRHPDTRQARFASLLQEVHSPELLTLALLFHDVGKWRNENHAEESVRLARSMFERLQLPEESQHTVDFLIRNHLEMSRMAFRRDSEDPEIVAQFAKLTGTEQHLKMLCLLTLVDIGAVSPDTLTPWKEDLLWRLYVDTYNRLTLGYADDVIDGDRTGLAVVSAGRPDDITEEELERFFDGLPRRYLALFGLSTIYRHVRLARGLQPDEVHSLLEKHDDIWELSVVTLDKPYLFSNISGVLSYFGMDIHRGQAMTTATGLVLDVFAFTDEERFLRQNPSASAEICHMLGAAVAGTVDVEALLRGKERSIVYRRRQRVPPVVNLDNEHSRKYTVVEIVADDAPGLLHRISRVISTQGCDVDLVLISTEGKKAIDVLHVTKEGRKLGEADQAALKERLQRILEPGHETD
jgi:[protein-PII] uridylyltransferase